jgi:hypothetical protein
VQRIPSRAGQAFPSMLIATRMEDTRTAPAAFGDMPIDSALEPQRISLGRIPKSRSDRRQSHRS